MSGGVDVLAVMDRGIADLMEGHCTLWTARDVKAMRAAVAELVEAAGVLLTEWDRQDTGRFDGMTAKDFFAAEARFRAAIAKATGGQP